MKKMLEIIFTTDFLSDFSDILNHLSILIIHMLSKKIDNAISYFCEHYNEPINIDDYAKENHFSTSWFIRNFKLYTGITPKQYILKKEYIMQRHYFKIHNIISMKSHRLLVMTILCILAVFFKRQKEYRLLNIAKTYHNVYSILLLYKLCIKNRDTL